MRSRSAVRSRLASRLVHADDGMTLVELLVAITVMLIVLAGVAAGATSGLNLARTNSNRIVAANVADERIGDVRAMEYADIPQSTVTGTVVQGGVTYTWTRDAETVFLDAEASCEAPAGAFNASRLSYLRVVVEVTWPTIGDDGINPVRSETVIDPPVTDYDPYRGHLSAKVGDRDGQPLAGITVRLRNASGTPTTSRFDTTDADGCVFFDNLDVEAGETVGNYHVWLDRPGWVDRASGLGDTSLQSPEPVVNVVSGQLRKIEFTYDEAAYLDVSIAGQFGGTPIDGLPVTIANDNYNNGNGPVQFPSATALAAEPLHPFPAGFALWAGACASADPGPSDRTRLVTDPGTTTAGDVLIGTVQMAVYRRTGSTETPVTGATIVATDACGNSYDAATTDGAGTASMALPYGTWTLSVQGEAPRSPGSWPSVALSPSDAAAPVITKRVW